MKKFAFLLIVFSLIVRVVFCGHIIDQGVQLNQLAQQQTKLISEIDNLFSQNSQASSVTRLTNLNTKLSNLSPLRSLETKSLIIAQSQ